MSQNSTPPLELPPGWNTPSNSSVANLNRSIPTPVASFSFTNNRPFTMGTVSKTNNTRRFKKVNKKSTTRTPLTSNQVRTKIGQALWSNEPNNITPKRQRLTFANNTNPVSPNNANTQPLSQGGRRRIRRTHRKRKHRRTCRR
jgi:hypothetical protein